MDEPRPILFQILIDQILKAADPFETLSASLPDDRSTPLHVIGAGKAAAKMAAALEENWKGPIQGSVIVPKDHDFPTKSIKVIETSSPKPDMLEQQVACDILQEVSDLGGDDHVIVLISAGFATLLAVPIDGVCLDEISDVRLALEQAGATPEEINCVVRHLSQIEGGGLARAIYPAKLSAYAISNQAENELLFLEGGACVFDPTTLGEAREIIEKYEIGYDGPFAETEKEGADCFETLSFDVISNAGKALYRAAHKAVQKGYNCDILSDVLNDDVRDLALLHLDEIEQILRGNGPLNPPCILLSGGKGHVDLTDASPKACGGRNTEFLLHLLEMTQGMEGVYALSLDTDGSDGGQDNAGAWFGPKTYDHLKNKDISIEKALGLHRSYDFFNQGDHLLSTGPTLTDINDFRLILLDPPKKEAT